MNIFWLRVVSIVLMGDLLILFSKSGGTFVAKLLKNQDKLMLPYGSHIITSKDCLKIAASLFRASNFFFCVSHTNYNLIFGKLFKSEMKKCGHSN